MPTIRRLLIANRGEIAVRIARTAHRMGIGTVGVYAEPDVAALHVDAVDVAVALGGSSPSDSYLRADLVLEAARRTGADAVHPGYGFLAENAAFAQAVIDAGLTWVGPTPEQIRLLGDKVAAKKAAIAAGVPTTPIVEVSDGRLPDDVTYPALVKAAAGGGGRGMRVVRSADELADALASAAREAQAAFGDGTVFIEPFIERGRHIEVQILGDHHGTVVHLGERECSIQRRNQKIVEEAPSAGIGTDVRRRVLDGALALAAHVGYHGAGTVEFLVGDDDTVAFLEVNTRLQVEHPVTEAVTGVDLVEWQLRIAAGEPLTLQQGWIAGRGHAIEVRVVAEDPAAGWLPSTGTLEAFAVDDATVRVDTGVRTGSVVSADYDSLLAKVIAHGPTRQAAAATLARALRSAHLAGVRTNRDALVAILEEPDFLAAATPTRYLDEHPHVCSVRSIDGDDRLALLLAAVVATDAADRATDTVTGFAPSGWRNLRTHGERSRWRSDDGDDQAVEHATAGDAIDVRVGPWPEPGPDGVLGADHRRRVRVRLLSQAEGRVAVELDGVRHPVSVDRRDNRVHTRSAVGSLTWQRLPRFVEHDAEQAGSGPVSPLPGTVLAVHVTAGQRIADGQLLVVVEAMKMEHRIHATGDATVTEVHVTAGSRVDAGDLLVSLAPLTEQPVEEEHHG